MIPKHDPSREHQPDNYDEEQTDDVIVHFVLARLLPSGHVLALRRFQETLSHPTLVQEQPRMLGEQLFSTTEVSLLLPLLDQYPHYCPYEVLWASFHGSTSEKAIARARTRLQRAREEGYWDEEMRPLRNMLSRARLRLQEMGLDIVSLFETGYLLTRHYRRRLRRKTNEDGGERDAPR
jgi:hypothetical protein